MRRWGVWCVLTSLILGLAMARTRAGDDDDDGDAKPPARPGGIRWSPYFAKMFDSPERKPAPKPVTPKPKKETAKKPAEPPKPRVVDEAVAERAQEEANLMRRLQVCDKLMEIAIRTNDTELLHRVEALEERAQTAYAQRTSYMRGVRADSHEPTPTSHNVMKPAIEHAVIGEAAQSPEPPIKEDKP